MAIDFQSPFAVRQQEMPERASRERFSFARRALNAGDTSDDVCAGAGLYAG